MKQSSRQLKSIIIGVTFMTVAMLSACSSHIPNRIHRNALARLFNSATSVKILSYTNRMYEKPLIDGEEIAQAPKDTVFFHVGKLAILESTIKETLVLNREQTDSLLTLLKTDMCKFDGTAICYDPAHAIVFFNGSGQPFGYIELCFSCTNYETSGDFDMDFCYEKSEALKDLFQSFGIKYFGENALEQVD
jgi:hypothetical protein